MCLRRRRLRQEPCRCSHTGVNLALKLQQARAAVVTAAAAPFLQTIQEPVQIAATLSWRWELRSRKMEIEWPRKNQRVRAVDWSMSHLSTTIRQSISTTFTFFSCAAVTSRYCKKPTVVVFLAIKYTDCLSLLFVCVTSSNLRPAWCVL